MPLRDCVLHLLKKWYVGLSPYNRHVESWHRLPLTNIVQSSIYRSKKKRYFMSF